MIPTFECSASAKNTSFLKLWKADFVSHYSLHSPDPSTLAHHSSDEISNFVQGSPLTVSAHGASVDDTSFFFSPRSPTTFHFGRVATVNHHDTNAWTQERNAHDTKVYAVATPSSLGSNGSSSFSPASVARKILTVMELRTQGLGMAERSSDDTCREDPIFWLRGRTNLDAPGSGVAMVQAGAAVASCSHEDLYKGRRRVGEILVRCGVVNVAGMSPVEPTAVGRYGTSEPCAPNAPGISNEIPSAKNDGVLNTALASWTSDWVYALVIQPYLRGCFRFQYQGKPNSASAFVALRIHRVLSIVHNPVQVAIYALWSIGTLARNGAHDNAPFLSIPIFRYLHNNGTFTAEDFMLRTFVTCAMIGDKTINDATLSTSIWNRLTRIPQAILNATEKYTLSCLKWDVVMTRTQWQDTIAYLRSCIKMGSVFDPFTYDDDTVSGTMARYLDELIGLSYIDETTHREAAPLAIEIHAPQPTQPPPQFTRWEVIDAAEWCPEDDPVVNQKPRTVGIAPGADQSSGTLKAGTTAKDILDSILGTNDISYLAHLACPAGTLFRGSLGTIGAHFSHTVRIART